jgi:hypothetical protein
MPMPAAQHESTARAAAPPGKRLEPFGAIDTRQSNIVRAAECTPGGFAVYLGSGLWQCGRYVDADQPRGGFTDNDVDGLTPADFQQKGSSDERRNNG